MIERPILVIGATGETGRAVVRLLTDGGRAVRALVHKDDDRAEVLRSAGAEIVVGELLDHDQVVRAVAGTRAAYFCYPVRPGLVQATAYFLNAAKRAGLEFIVNMSQISAREDSLSHAARDHWIAERMFDDARLPVVHLRPTFFSQWMLYPFARKTIVEDGVIDLPYGSGRHAPIAAEDQARLIVRLLLEPETHVGRTYTLHGPIELDQAGIAAAISEVLEREIRYRPLSIPEYRERLERFGLADFRIQHFCAIAVDSQNGIFAGADGIIAEVTGTSPMTVQEFVALHRSAFERLDAGAAA